MLKHFDPVAVAVTDPAGAGDGRWPVGHHLAQLNEPDGHLGWSSMMYVSFTVLTSTAFGEITPVTHMARSVIVLEQVLGVMCVAFLVALLANLWGREDPQP